MVSAVCPRSIVRFEVLEITTLFDYFCVPGWRILRSEKCMATMRVPLLKARASPSASARIPIAEVKSVKMQGIQC